VRALGALAIMAALVAGASGAKADPFVVCKPTSAHSPYMCFGQNGGQTAALVVPSETIGATVFAGRAMNGAILTTMIGTVGGTLVCDPATDTLHVLIATPLMVVDQDLGSHCTS
jgi:hypothetical protein